jgi:hypothetical protein
MSCPASVSTLCFSGGQFLRGFGLSDHGLLSVSTSFSVSRFLGSFGLIDCGLLSVSTVCFHGHFLCGFGLSSVGFLLLRFPVFPPLSLFLCMSGGVGMGCAIQGSRISGGEGCMAMEGCVAMEGCCRIDASNWIVGRIDAIGRSRGSNNGSLFVVQSLITGVTVNGYEKSGTLNGTHHIVLGWGGRRFGFVVVNLRVRS